jgi:2-polyprenyl-3-methyl-5-hydroxy-6-metoxy-1,4-benzoquinol methylase
MNNEISVFFTAKMQSLTLKWKIAQFFEFLWWKNYLQGRTKDEYLKWKKDYWLAFSKHFKGLINESKPLQILDAGCGPSGIFMILIEHRVDAVDPLLQQYEQFPNFNKEDFPHVNFINNKLENYRKENFYEVIFCINAINHVDDIHSCLQNLYVSLKQGGTCIVAVDTHRSHLLKKIFQFLPGDILHPHQFSRADYELLFEKEKWRVEKTIMVKEGKIFNYDLFLLRKDEP